jgi:hypothetical protein
MTPALLVGLCACLAATPSPPPTPSVRVGLEHRLRGEVLVDDFRKPGPDPEDAAGLFLRSLGGVEVDSGLLVGTLEFIDARALLVGAAPSTSHVDALDVLQANVGVRLQGAFLDDDVWEVRVGRRTIDLGSRRLVARNEFRNTINAFTGIDTTWMRRGLALRGFVVTPVRRLPDDDALVAATGGPVDGLLPPWQPDVGTGALLVGATAAQTHAGIDILLTSLWLDEGADRRRLWSPSVWFRRAPRPGAFDFALEVMPQLGRTGDAGRGREHRALAIHASLGHRFDVAGRPRLVVAWDHASGDVDDDDDIDHRFDSLFGARRFEYGPTGLFGPLARADLSSPAVRLELGGADAELLLAARAAWRAVPTVSTSGPWRGGLGEVRLRGWPRGAVTPEVGVAAFAASELLRPSLFGWLQLTGRFST